PPGGPHAALPPAGRRHACAGTRPSARAGAGGLMRAPASREVHVWRLEAAPGVVLAHTVLARYLGDDVRPRKGANGKLELEQRAGLAFGVAHTAAVALVAVARADVGVDVEPLDRDVSGWQLPAHALAPSEMGADFLTTWVRKEALLKASGHGLAVE